MVTNITAWIKEELYPALYPHIPQALPEHNWTEDRRGWRSKTYLDGRLYPKDRNDKTKVLKASPGYIFEEGGEGKSLVDYVIERDRLTFIEAVRKLSAVAGLQPPSLDIKDQDAYRKAQERTGLLEEATSYMSWSLLNATAKNADAVRKYLQEDRGYTMEAIEAMGLGYLPSWEQMRTYLVGKGYQGEAIEEALTIGKDGRLGDTHTLAIPYRTGSRIQGYAFRTVTGAEPKYLNSPGMDRKAGLFNLSPLKGTKDLVVVEGYLDALHATVKGLENVVAVGAASLSREHVEDAVAKGARAVTLCFDADQGGRKGTDQALEVLRSFPSLKVYVAQLPAGAEKMDPDQLIREQGADALRAVIASAIPAWEHELGKLLEPFAQGELQPKEVDQLLQRAVVTANDIADPIDRDRFTSAFLFQVEGLGVTKESLDAVAEALRYQHKRDQQKKAVEGLLRSVGKDLDAGEPGAAIDRIGEGLQSLRAVRGADLLHPATYTGWLDTMRTAPAALRTGYAALDRITRIPQAAVTLVAGRPGHGKTTVMYNLLLSMAEVYPRKRFLFFTYEEPSEHILTKLLNSLLGEDLSHLYHEYEEASNNYAYLKAYLRSGRADVPVVEAGKEKLRGFMDSQRIQVVDGNYSVEDLDGILTGELKKGPELGAVFLDYIQRMSTSRQTQDKRTEIAHISHQVLQIAKRTGLPLILGAQINRDAGKEHAGAKVKEPALDNLKEAGNLEEDANLVLSVFNLSREQDKAEDGKEWGRVVDLKLVTLKNRDGKPNAKAVLSFDSWTGKVTDPW
jgi:DNA primase catalytic core